MPDLSAVADDIGRVGAGATEVQTISAGDVVIWTAAGVPSRPAAPTLSSRTTTSLSVAWVAPNNNGATITDYDVQYREGTSGAFSAWPHTGTSRTATITGLDPNTAYQVQVRAQNSVGESSWSSSLTATTASIPDLRPTFGSASIPTQSYTHGTAVNVQLPTATSGDTPRTYSLSPSLPAGLSFSSSTRRITGTPTEAASAASFTYTVTDVDGDTDTLMFNLSVAATVPGAPSLSFTGHDSSGDHDVSWSQPNNGGSPITFYSGRWRYEAGPGSWSSFNTNDTLRTATIRPGDNDVNIHAQVRAVNVAGAGGWSSIVTIRP